MVQFIRRQQAAKMLGVKPSTLAQWDQRGTLKVTRLSPRVIGYVQSDIEAFIEARKAKGGTK